MSFKTFVAGDVLTASEVNTYLMKQAVIVCTAATRPSSPNEGMVIMETDTDRILVYTGAVWERFGWSSSSGRTGATLVRNANQLIATATDSTITWDTENQDTDGFIAVPATTWTVPATKAGVYVFGASIAWAANPGTSTLNFLEVNSYWNYSSEHGSANRPQNSGGTYVTGICAVHALVAGDTIALRLRQSSGAGINVTAVLTAYRIGA